MAFVDLFGWLKSKDPNRRKYPRKTKPYWATISLDGGVTRKPAMGIDISGGGLCVLTQEPLPKPEFDIFATIDSYEVRARSKSIWQDMGTLGGKTVWRYGATFTGIAADHWDAIIRYATDLAMDEGNKAQRELEAIRLSPDDASRLFPAELQQKLLSMLVDRRRLAPLRENVTPLVQYFYSGVVNRKNTLLHELTIESRVAGAEETEKYETTFLFDGNGKEVRILDDPTSGLSLGHHP